MNRNLLVGVALVVGGAIGVLADRSFFSGKIMAQQAQELATYEAYAKTSDAALDAMTVEADQWQSLAKDMLTLAKMEQSLHKAKADDGLEWLLDKDKLELVFNEMEDNFQHMMDPARVVIQINDQIIGEIKHKYLSESN